MVFGNRSIVIIDMVTLYLLERFKNSKIQIKDVHASICRESKEVELGESREKIWHADYLQSQRGFNIETLKTC